MKQLYPALFASAALHAAVFATVQAGTAPRARQVEQRSVEIEVFATGAGLSGPAEAAAAPVVPAPARAVARRSARHSKPAPTPVAVLAIEARPALAPATAAAESISAPVAAGPRAIVKSGDLDLTAFFLRLQSAAQRCSGPRAGEGKVRFCVDAAGAPVEVSLVQSTGNFALDDAALHCVIPGAAPFPHTDRCLVVPLRFQ